MRENRGVSVKGCKSIGRNSFFLFLLIMLFDCSDKITTSSKSYSLCFVSKVVVGNAFLLCVPVICFKYKSLDCKLCIGMDRNVITIASEIIEVINLVSLFLIKFNNNRIIIHFTFYFITTFSK